tara:strand:- start:70 stop:813 length:744 start_codon:yes stop_codon:yes gene_type:complete
MIKLNFKNYRDKYLFWIALFFLFAFIFNSIVISISSTPIRLFWFCNISLLFVAIAIFIRSPNILLAFLSMSLILQGIWISDILSLAFFGENIFGTSYYLFLSQYGGFENLITAIHFFIIPLEFFAFVFMNKLPRKFSTIVLNIFLFSLGFLGISLIFGPERNINYIYSIPFNFEFIFPNHLTFFFRYLLFIIIFASFIGYLIYSIFKKYRRLFNIKNLKLYFWIILIFCFILALKITSFILKTRETL